MSDENYIDKLYKDAFKGYELQPKKELDLTKHVPKEALSSRNTLSKLLAKKWLVFAGVIAVAGIAAFIVFSVSEEKPSQEQNQVVPPAPDEYTPSTPAIQSDTAAGIKPVPVEVEKPLNKRPSVDRKGKIAPKADSVSVHKPVIIRKTIIQRDTVIEHKQVIKKVAPTHEN
jgi:cytoskeletal protein RodZ